MVIPDVELPATDKGHEMNMYEIVNIASGVAITGAMGYTEAQRYMRDNNVSREEYEMKIYVPVRRNATEAPVQDEAETKRAAIKAIIADAYETNSYSGCNFINVEFKDKRTAAIRKAQFENAGIQVETCGNPSWLRYFPNN